jgi:peptide-methionine (S)-S-oxide reductase
MSSTIARSGSFGAALRRVLPLAAVFGTIALAGFAVRAMSQEEKGRTIPAPSVDETAGDAKSEVAVLAGGCFWGVQGVYQHVKGVKSAISGYAGGQKNTAQYDVVSRGDTGHAESVRVTFDPRKITYGQILQVFFSVAHDPTQLNRQGPDHGTQYRSAIFAGNAEQARVAEAYITQLNDARVFDRPIVTKIELERPFYQAEPYHQDFLQRNPTYPYIVINDMPKIGELKRLFPDLYQSSPVLVGITQ